MRRLTQIVKIKEQGSEQTKTGAELEAAQRATEAGEILMPPHAKQAVKDKRRRRTNATAS